MLEDASFHPGAAGATTCASSPPPAATPRSRVDEVLEHGRASPTRGEPAGEGLLDGHAPAARDRRGAARRPRGADPRRAGQRARSARASAGCASCCASEAGRGRAVLVSSHLLSEVAQSVDDVVVISRGELRASGSAAAGARTGRGRGDRVRARDAEALGAGAGRGRARARSGRVRGAAGPRRRARSDWPGRERPSAWRSPSWSRVGPLARGRLLRPHRGRGG